MKRTPDYRKFVMLDEREGHLPAYDGKMVLLYPFRNVSVQSFSFPFSGVSRVREALRIRFKPLLGEGADHVSIIPFFVENDKKSSTGCVFLLFGNETDILEERIATKEENYTIWPAILAFAGEVEGTGLIIMAGAELITTLWLENWTPKFYKATDSARTSAEEEERLALDYIAEQGGSVEKILLVDRSDVTETDLQSCGEALLGQCAAYEHLDLSSKRTNRLEKRERTVSALSRIGRIAIISGLVFLLIVAGLYWHRSALLQAGAANAEALYLAAFGERSRQPVSSAQAKLRAVGDVQVDQSLNAMLRGITEVWDKLDASADLSIENLRYGSENTDMIGTAGNNESIQRLRTLLEEAGLSPKTDNIQSIPGGKLRFNLSITKGGKS